MNAKKIIDQSLIYATQIIVKELSPGFVYHNLDHTLSVYKQCRILGEHEGISEEGHEILSIAALFHDLGYLKGYTNHETFSSQMATTFLKKENYPEDKLAKVIACIDATIVDRSPKTLLEQIIKDADLTSLGSEDFEASSKNLRSEWKTFCNELYTDREWYQINYDFLEKHSYFTDSAKLLYDSGKKVNTSKMKKLLKKKQDS